MINEKSRIYGTVKKLSVDELKDAFARPEAGFIDVALLFGSRAEGTSNVRSDYDFALLMKKDCDTPWGVKSKAYNVLMDILGLDACDLDIVDLSNAESVIMASIKDSYIILKGDSDEISRLLEQDSRNRRRREADSG